MEENYQEVRQKSFLARLTNELALCGGDRYRYTRLLVLGHCIAAVEDTFSGGECDVFFATAMWMPKSDIWGDLPHHPRLEAIGIARLPGIGSTDQLRRVEDGEWWAKRWLSPIYPSRGDLWEPGHAVQQL